MAQLERIATLSPLIEAATARCGLEYAALLDRDDAVYSRVKRIRESVKSCNADRSADVVVYIAKMTEIRTADLCQTDVLMLSQRKVAIASNSDSTPPPSHGDDDWVWAGCVQYWSIQCSRTWRCGFHGFGSSVQWVAATA